MNAVYVALSMENILLMESNKIAQDKYESKRKHSSLS